MFTLACGDVMPGCPARFEGHGREELLGQVATHTREAHGIVDLTSEVRQGVEAKIAG